MPVRVGSRFSGSRERGSPFGAGLFALVGIVRWLAACAAWRRSAHRDVCLLMNAEPYPSWDEKLNRALQSWRDSAAHQARRPMFADDRTCEDCRRDPYVIIAQLEYGSTAHRWPHWLQHTLREHLIDVRGELSEALALRPHAGATIAAFLDGAGLRTASGAAL